MRLIFLGLVLFCLQGYGSSLTSITSAEDMLPTYDVSVLPANTTPTVDSTTEDVNVTVPILQITDYHYLDWPKIGYQIFMKKMMEAFQTLKFFISLDPMILKTTRTYILTNDTDLDYLDNSYTDEDSDKITLQDDLSNETNTESPLKVPLIGKLKDSNGDKIISSVKKEPNHSEESNEVIKTKTEKGGFFSGISHTLSSIFSTIVGWF